MQKQGFLLIIALFVSAWVQAQSLGFGAKVGLNLNRLPGGKEAAVAAGFHAGVFGTVKILGVGARAELLISGKGGETTIDYTNTNVTTQAKSVQSLVSNANLWYLDVPILFEYKLPVIPIYFNVGPQFSFLLNDKVSLSNVSVPTSSADVNAITDELKKQFAFNSSEVALVLGAGVTVFKIDAGIRYTLGLTKASNFNTTATAVNALSSVDLKNHVFQVYVGFKFL